MKQPFSPEGAANVLASLYQLPDDALNLEAQAFNADLKNWLRQHFELNSHQAEYLEQLNPEATAFYAQQGSFAMQHRLPISLDVAAKENADEEDPEEEGDKDKQGKIVYTKSSVTAVADGEGTMLPEGALYYYIRY